MNRRSFLARLAALGAGIVVVGPSVLAEVQRHLTPANAVPWVMDARRDAYYVVYNEYLEIGCVPRSQLTGRITEIRNDRIVIDT